MKKGVVLLLIFLILLLAVVFGRTIGNVVSEEGFRGISESKQVCMETCVAVGCDAGDDECMIANSEKCMGECGVEEHTPQDEGEACMEECIAEYCEEGPEYADCMGNYIEECEEECDMKGDAPDESEMSAEQVCITECVGKVDPLIICGSSKEGETGNEVCQRCADECVVLYEGPCLSDEELSEKERACETCEHCYGEPVTGPSGEGWDCIVDVECKDASIEFGDNPGEGPGIVEGIGNAVGNAVGGVVEFFKDLFDFGEEEPESEAGKGLAEEED